MAVDPYFFRMSGPIYTATYGISTWVFLSLCIRDALVRLSLQ